MTPDDKWKEIMEAAETLRDAMNAGGGRYDVRVDRIDYIGANNPRYIVTVIETRKDRV